MEELQTQDIPIIILLGTLGMLLLVGSMGLFVLIYQRRVLTEKQIQATRELEYQNQMIQLGIESQERERTRIGSELHDSLGSLLWGAKVNATFIKRSIDLPASAQDSYNELIEILDESIRTVRKISWEISPEAFHFTGLAESVKKVCHSVNGKGMTLTYEENKEVFWNSDDALNTFRIVQELISNALKHSKGSAIEVSFNWQLDKLSVTVSDNGIGFDPTEVRQGVGFWNIDRRIKKLKGTFSIGGTPMENGTRISFTIPFIHGESEKSKNLFG